MSSCLLGGNPLAGGAKEAEARHPKRRHEVAPTNPETSKKSKSPRGVTGLGTKITPSKAKRGRCAKAEPKSSRPQEAAMVRSVGLDLGSRKIAFCEVKNGKVIRRATVESLKQLEGLLGPGSGVARVAVEAGRTAWAIHAELTGWGHDVMLIDTTRVKQMGIGPLCTTSHENLFGSRRKIMLPCMFLGQAWLNRWWK